jgi:hypothetical protein
MRPKQLAKWMITRVNTISPCIHYYKIMNNGSILYRCGSQRYWRLYDHYESVDKALAYMQARASSGTFIFREII